MSLRNALVLLGLLAAWGGLAGTARAQFEVDPADHILVLDVGKSGKVKVKAPAGEQPTWTASSDAKSITVSPAEAGPSGSRTFTVKAEDAFPGEMALITITPSVESDGGPIVVTAYVVMDQKAAEKLLKKESNAALKELRSNLKTNEKEAKVDFDDLLVEAETGLDALTGGGDGDPEAQVPGLLNFYVLQGRALLLIVLFGLLAAYHLAVVALASQAYSWLLAYSLPIVAPLAFMTGGGGAWDLFVGKALGFLLASASVVLALFAKFLVGLIALGASYGSPLAVNYVTGELHPPCLLGPTNTLVSDAPDGFFIDDIPLQLLLLIAYNRAGQATGLIGVDGFADPAKGDVTVSIEELRGEVTDTVVVVVNPQGLWQATLGLDVPKTDASGGGDGPPIIFGLLPPGPYRVMISQGDAMIVKYIDVPLRQA